MPYGFIALGKFGFVVFKFFPFDLLSYILPVFFLQWFCFGLSSEIIKNFNSLNNAMLLPLIGFLVSLFIFDFIHFTKSFYYNFKYLRLIEISIKEMSILKTSNELLGGKIISIGVFFYFI